MEIWKDIDGYEGHYQVSNYGNVRSVKSVPILLKGDYQRNGYKRVYLWKDGGKKNLLVHRLVALSFLENPCGFTDVNHIDEDKANNHVSNLQWCSHLYNMNYGSVKRKISLANTGRTASDSTREKLSKDTSRRRWIHDDRVERYVYSCDLEKFISIGWEKGRLKNRRN